MCTIRKSPKLRVPRATVSIDVAAFSCKRGPEMGGTPESPHGASLKHGAELAETASILDVDTGNRPALLSGDRRPQQQDACRHLGPHAQTRA
jgi:hypothetical protein